MKRFVDAVSHVPEGIDDLSLGVIDAPLVPMSMPQSPYLLSTMPRLTRQAVGSCDVCGSTETSKSFIIS